MSNSINNNSPYDPYLIAGTVYSSSTNNFQHPIDIKGKPVVLDVNATTQVNDNSFIEDNNNMYGEIAPTTNELIALDLTTTLPSVNAKQIITYTHIKDEMAKAGFIVSSGNQWNNRDQMQYFYWANGINTAIAGNTAVDNIKKDYGFAYSEEMPIAITNLVSIYQLISFRETKTPRVVLVDGTINVFFIVQELNNQADIVLLNKNDGSQPIPVPTNIEFFVSFKTGTYNLFVSCMLNGIVRTPLFLNLEVTNPIVLTYEITPIWKFITATNQITTGAIVEKNGLATSLLWNFGDGTIAITDNNNSQFVHYFSKAGTYNISVIATVDGQAQPIAYTQLPVTVEDIDTYNLVPVCDFIAKINEPVTIKGYEINGNCDCVILNFGDLSSNQIIQNFDSSVSYSHVYNTKGIYEISMTAIVKGKTLPKQICYPYTVITDNNILIPYSLTCNWLPNQTLINTNIYGTITEFGINKASSLIVDYGDGSELITITNFYGKDSQLIHSYNKEGTYVIFITPVINGVNQTTVTCFPVLITNNLIYSSQINWSPSTQEANLQVTGTFVEYNGTASHLFVDFGDGQALSTTKFIGLDSNLHYIYNNPGVYNIVTTPTVDGVNQSVINQSVTIIPAIISYSAICTWLDNPVYVNNYIYGTLKEYGNSGIASSLLVDYGDGVVETVTNILKLSHVYSFTGNYTIIVTPKVLGINQTSIYNVISVVENPAMYQCTPAMNKYECVVGETLTGTVSNEVNGKATSFTWNFSDGTELIIVNPGDTVEHTYNEEGIYTCFVKPLINNVLLDNFNCDTKVTVLKKPETYNFLVNWNTNYVQVGKMAYATVQEFNGLAACFYAYYNTNYNDGVWVTPADSDNKIGTMFNLAGNKILNLVAYDKLSTDESKIVIGTSATNSIVVINNKSEINSSGYKAILIIPKLNVVAGSIVSMYLSEINKNASKFIWNFGDGVLKTYEDSDLNAEYVYNKIGSYNVSVVPYINNVAQAEIFNLDSIVVSFETIQEPNPVIYQDPIAVGKIAGDKAYSDIMQNVMDQIGTRNYTDAQKQANLNANQANAQAQTWAVNYNKTHNLRGN